MNAILGTNRCPTPYLKLRSKIQSLIDNGDSCFTRSLGKFVKIRYPKLWKRTCVNTGSKRASDKFGIKNLLRILDLPVRGKCQECGEVTSFDADQVRPRLFCSQICRSSSPLTRSKISASHLGMSSSRRRELNERAKRTRQRTYDRLYGGLHPMQTSEVLLRQQLSCFSLKRFRSRTGEIHLFQGYENVILEALDNADNVASYYTNSSGNIPGIGYADRGKQRVYRPDILVEMISGKRYLIEVKSNYTLGGFRNPKLLQSNLVKFQAAHEWCSRQKNTLFRVAIVWPSESEWDFEFLRASDIS